MIEEHTYNPSVDNQAVVSGLALDLGSALKTGKIPVKVGPSDALYNGIDNPANVGGRPSDIFDSMRMEREVYMSAKAAAAAKKAAAKSEPASGGAPATSQE